jgi:transcription elongation factor Elf1
MKKERKKRKKERKKEKRERETIKSKLFLCLLCSWHDTKESANHHHSH